MPRGLSLLGRPISREIKNNICLKNEREQGFYACLRFSFTLRYAYCYDRKRASLCDFFHTVSDYTRCEEGERDLFEWFFFFFIVIGFRLWGTYATVNCIIVWNQKTITGLTVLFLDPTTVSIRFLFGLWIYI